MQDTLPLFPLGTVLFPGVVLPLYVFEPRYRLLVRELIADDDRPREFGVIGIRQGWEVGVDGVTALYRVGCTAVLRQVTGYDDGRFDIVTTGRRRFRLDAVDTDSRPYLRGQVEWLPDPLGDPGEAAVLARGVAELFSRCRRLLLASGSTGEPDDPAGGPARGAGPAGADEAPDAPLPDDPRLLSYLVGAATPLPLEDRQDLLTAADVVDRLRRELRLLKREATMVSLLRAVPVPLATLRVPASLN